MFLRKLFYTTCYQLYKNPTEKIPFKIQYQRSLSSSRIGIFPPPERLLVILEPIKSLIRATILTLSTSTQLLYCCMLFVLLMFLVSHFKNVCSKLSMYAFKRYVYTCRAVIYNGCNQLL